MLHSAVYIAILILASLNFYTECGRSNRTLCPKEMNVLLTNQSKANASADMWPNICSNDTGCCNKTTRNKLREQITTSVLNLIQERNENLRRRLKYVYDELEVVIHDVLNESSATIADSLQFQVNRNLAHLIKPHLLGLFDKLRTSLSSRDIKAQNITEEFFRNIYPIVYQHTVARKELPEDFAVCLKDYYNVIDPFKNVPFKLRLLIMNKFGLVQQFLHNYKTIGHVMDVLDRIQLSDNCITGLILMRHCPLCSRLQDVETCGKYCREVMVSCLKPYNELENVWSDFINKFKIRQRYLAKSLAASALFSKLQEILSEAVSHASHVNVKYRVTKHCHNITEYKANAIVSLKSPKKKTDWSNEDLYLTNDDQKPYQDLLTSKDVGKRLIFLRNNLTEFEKYLRFFHFAICTKNGGLFASSSEKKCWITAIDSDHHLKPVNNYRMKNDVLQLMGKVLDRQKSTFRPPATEASGYGSGVDTGSGSGDHNTYAEPSGESGCGDDEECGSSDDDNVSSFSTPDDEEFTTEAVIAPTSFSKPSESCSFVILAIHITLCYIFATH